MRAKTDKECEKRLQNQHLLRDKKICSCQCLLEPEFESLDQRISCFAKLLDTFFWTQSRHGCEIDGEEEGLHRLRAFAWAMHERMDLVLHRRNMDDFHDRVDVSLVNLPVLEDVLRTWVERVKVGCDGAVMEEECSIWRWGRYFRRW